jgi:hypothetical protein
MRAGYTTVVILCFLIIKPALGKDCGKEIVGASYKAKIEYVQNLLANPEHSCAVQATGLLARSFATLPNRDGFDARFALRELALEETKNSNTHSSSRVELIEAATGSLQRSKPIPNEEIIADVRFLIEAMKVLQKQDDVGSWLGILCDAIQLNQQLPDEQRAIQSSELNGIDKAVQEYVYNSYSIEGWKKLTRIAEITRGDKDLLAFRSQLANWFTYWVPGIYDNRPREEIIERSKNILHLTELLDGTATGYQCKTGKLGDYGCSMNWQWKPYVRSGLAYHHVGMQNEAKRYVEQGLRVIESETNLRTRLQLYDFAIRDLIREHYDRSTLVDVSTKMQTLADSLGPKFAEEVRSNLANHSYGNW